MSQGNQTSENEVDWFIRRVSLLVGYGEPPPEGIRGLIEKLKAQGYSTVGVARQVRLVLGINEFGGKIL